MLAVNEFGFLPPTQGSVKDVLSELNNLPEEE
jgi:hypothetical protein